MRVSILWLGLTALMVAGAIAPRAVAQSEEDEMLLQVEGVLEEGDRVSPDDGSFYDTHSFEGQAGQTVLIMMESDEFDTYLLLADAQQRLVARNDDLNRTTTNSGIVATLPQDGSYIVVANGLNAENQGRYQLTVQAVEAPPAETSVPEAPPAETEAPEAPSAEIGVPGVPEVPPAETEEPEGPEGPEEPEEPEAPSAEIGVPETLPAETDAPEMLPAETEQR